MQFEALEIFCDVARNRSFSQAAQAQGITQSAVSHTISLLEKRLGIQLFDRSTRPLQLTAPGRTYYEGCRELLERYTELEATIRGAKTQLAGSVQVAAIYSVGLGDMGQYVELFRARQPGVKVQIEYLHPNQVYEKVLEGTADLGLVSFPRKSARLAAVPWREEEMVLVCAPQHPLAGNVAVRPEQLAGQKYIHFTRELVIRRKVDRFLREQGAAVKVVLEFDSIENIKKAVEISAGVALLPEPTIRPEVASRSLVARPLYGCRLTRPLGIIHRPRKLSAPARSFLEMLCGPETGRPSADGARNGHQGQGPQTRTTRPGRNGTSGPSTRHPPD